MKWTQEGDGPWTATLGSVQIEVWKYRPAYSATTGYEVRVWDLERAGKQLLFRRFHEEFELQFVLGWAQGWCEGRVSR